jgi:hypothetical protein
MNIGYHIRLTFSIPSYLAIILLWRTRHLRKKYLRNLHPRPKDDRDTIHIGKFEGDIEVVSRIDKSSSVMDDESDTGK